MKAVRLFALGVGCLLASAASAVSMEPVPAARQAGSPPASAAVDKDAAKRGEYWFYQRCSLCHMERIVKDEVFMPLGPNLKGLLKDAPARATQIRAFIKMGTLRMPGFQYGLSDQELDEVIAFLKTF